MYDASSGARGYGAGRTQAPFLRFHDCGLDLAPGIALIANVARLDEPPRHLVRAPEGLATIFAAAYGDAALGRSLFPILARIASSLDARDAFIAWSIAQEIVLPPLSDLALKRAAQASDGRLERAIAPRAWDESQHPRHPAGSPGGTGGEFAPAGGGSLLVPVVHRKPPPRRPPPRDHNNPPSDRPPQVPLVPERPPRPETSNVDEPPEDRERRERLKEQGFPKTIDELRIDSSNDGYSSHDQIIRQNGPAGPGKQYHHIVEQHPRNVERFGPFEIHNNDNVIILPREVHESISGHYSSKPKWTKGKTVRDWFADKSYEEQHRYGIEQLRKAGVLQ